MKNERSEDAMKNVRGIRERLGEGGCVLDIDANTPTGMVMVTVKSPAIGELFFEFSSVKHALERSEWRRLMGNALDMWLAMREGMYFQDGVCRSFTMERMYREDLAGYSEMKALAASL